jgi:hypothetical protein
MILLLGSCTLCLIAIDARYFGTGLKYLKSGGG